MSYFNQQKYSNSNTETESKASNEPVEKGHKNMMKVDIAKFDELCKKFRDRKDLKIKKLTGADKEDFNLAVSYVHLLYGTSYYSHLYDRVRKYFEKVTSVKPGTVGAYFAGCLVTVKEDSNTSNSSSSIIPGCAIGCAGSMPLPRDEEGWSFCDKAVILAEKGKDGYIFSVVKPANSSEEMDPAYLFVESKSLHDFHGFSKEEKDQIRAFGCNKVKLVGYGNDLTYSDLYTEPKSISDIKHRHVYSHKKEENNTWKILGIILIILLLLILCFLGYKYYSM